MDRLLGDPTFSPSQGAWAGLLLDLHLSASVPTGCVPRHCAARSKGKCVQTLGGWWHVAFRRCVPCVSPMTACPSLFLCPPRSWGLRITVWSSSRTGDRMALCCSALCFCRVSRGGVPSPCSFGHFPLCFGKLRVHILGPFFCSFLNTICKSVLPIKEIGCW